MAKYQIINTSTKIVENTVEWDGDLNKWAPLDGFIGVASTVSGIGWKYNSEGVGIGTTSGKRIRCGFHKLDMAQPFN